MRFTKKGKSKFQWKMTIRKKIAISFLSVTIILGAIGILSSINLMKINTTYTDLIDRKAVIISNTLKIEANLYKENSLMRGYIMSRDPKFIDQIREVYEIVDQLFTETYPLIGIPEFKEKLTELQTGNEQYKQKYEQVFQMIEDDVSFEEVSDFYVNEVLPLDRKSVV